jgi:hypothetical protein
MLRSKDRSAYVIALGALASIGVAFGLAGRAGAEAQADSDMKASMQCDRANEPGRVRCTVEVHIEGGRTLAWADVEILALPDFASALKGRIGPQDALARDAASTKWAFALVARRSGQGVARAGVRAVACDAPRPAPSASPRASARAGAGAASGTPPPRCTPVTVEVRAQVTVGG